MVLIITFDNGKTETLNNVILFKCDNNGRIFVKTINDLTRHFDMSNVSNFEVKEI